METKPSEVIFFLGAGASVAAGVPDTLSFVKEFRESIQEITKKATIEKIIDILEETEKRNADIELLLETLTKLNERDKEPLLRFYTDCKYILEDSSEKKPLIYDLKNFIKRRAIVSKENVGYLKPLKDLIEKYVCLDIISLNYDTCIEQFCSVHKFEYQDGFDSHWNPETFNRINTQIRLYKVHGSINWYKSENGDYWKSDVFTENIEIQHMGGEKAENLMLYPMQKIDYAGPSLELLVHIKRLLESETCKILIVVGYSFRDPHIQRILWEASKKNRGLHLFLIDPHAYEIYNKRLKYYNNDASNLSPLDGRVICLPYLFQKILPALKKEYLNNLNEGQLEEVNQHENEILGKNANLISAIEKYLDAEFIEKAESLLQRDPLDIEKYPMKSLKFPLLMAMNLTLAKEEENASKYLRQFLDRFIILAVEKFHLSLEFGPRTYQPDDIPDEYLRFDYNYSAHEGGASYIQGKELIDFIGVQVNFCQSRMEFAGLNDDKSIKILNKLKKLKEYFDPFYDGKIELEQYFKLRENEYDFDTLNQELQVSRVDFVRSDRSGFGASEKSLLLERRRLLESRFENVERKILREIITKE